jgi:hypothetical protein
MATTAAAATAAANAPAATLSAIASSITAIAPSLDSWHSTCAMNLAAAVLTAPASAITYVGESGSAIGSYGPNAWGVTYDTCVAYCGEAEIPNPVSIFLEERGKVLR